MVIAELRMPRNGNLHREAILTTTNSLVRQSVRHVVTRFIAPRSMRDGHADVSRDRPAAQTRKLLEEARALCRDARSVRLPDADMDALRARFGESAPDVKVALALRGIMRRRVHDWLRRAEWTVSGSRLAAPADEQ